MPCCTLIRNNNNPTCPVILHLLPRPPFPQLRDATLLQSSLAAKQRLVSDYEARGRGREAARAAAAVEALRGQLEAAGARLSAKEAELQEL